MVMDALNTIILFCLGGFLTMIIDVVWWRIDYKKAEKGMEVLEHYHIGLGLIITALIVNLFYQPAAWFLSGFGFFFILAEWHQSIEIAGRKVVPGKPFAYGSKHFKGSTIIGIALVAILLILSVIL